MEVLTGVKVIRKKTSGLPGVDFKQLEFGKYISDHMLVADYANGAWGSPQVLPFGKLSLSPTALALHYGQTVFEGMKAFRMQDGKINIFRLDKHYERFNRSLARMCMATIPYEIFSEGMMQLVSLDQNWVPLPEDGALYIRPFMYASEEKMGVKPSDEYRFVIFTAPVGSLFSRPIKVKIETEFIRAASGGTGSVKCGGNYGGALYPTQLAKEQGYDNVIWTDAKEHKYLEESGVMNLFFVIGGRLVTPSLSDTILNGLTRDALITLAREGDRIVEERPVSIDEIKKGLINGTVTEAFGVGTAAVVAPIASIGIDNFDYLLPVYSGSSICWQLKNKLEAIRSGAAADIHNWNFICS
jgi:branched-chain amino acid aminotransferase